VARRSASKNFPNIVPFEIDRWVPPGTERRHSKKKFHHDSGGTNNLSHSMRVKGEGWILSRLLSPYHDSHPSRIHPPLCPDTQTPNPLAVNIDI
jgi:hypothetical protein